MFKINRLNLRLFFVGLNIMFSLILLLSFLFPEHIFPIDYNSPIITESLLSTDSLLTRKEFYLFANIYSENSQLINKLAIFVTYVYLALSIIGSLSFRGNFIFTLLAVLIMFLWPIFLPSTMSRWETLFLYNSTIIFNSCLLTLSYSMYHSD